MPLANVALTDTFDTWRTRTNQLVVISNQATEGSLTTSGTITSTNTSATGAINVTAGFIRVQGNNFTSNQITLTSNSAALAISPVNNGRLGSTIFLSITGSNSIYDISTANIATANAVNALNQNVVAGLIAVNSYSVQVGAAANTWANSVSVVDRAVGNTAANSANAFAVTIGAASNTYANVLYVSALQNANNDANASNSFAVTIGAASNTWANTQTATRLANTSGVSFVGNLFFPSGNVGVGTSSTTAKIHGETSASLAQWGLKVKSVGVNNDSGFYVGATNDYEMAVRNASGTLTGVIRSGADSWVNLSAGNFGVGTASPSQKLHVVGTAFATADFRAPIFYDSDNTGYYVDPAGTSNIYNANFNNITSVGSSQYSVNIYQNNINAGYSYNGTAELALNYVGYLSGTTQFRDTYIFDGKTAVIASFLGSNKGTYLSGGLGVGTAASSTVGEIRATNNITAYYSDKRLKNIQYTILDAVAKVKQLSGVVYVNNDVAESFGYTDKSEQVGVIAQDVEQVLPQIVKLAPFDTEYVDGVEVSKSGENYKTVQYEKLIPLLIEAIKELSDEVETLKSRLGE